MVEEHARRPVHLRHDHALGAVDDEGAVIGHERHVAHVDILLLDVANGPTAGILVDVPDNQTQPQLQGRGIGQPTLDALFHVVLRLFQLVLHEFEPATAAKVIDRENRLEDLLQPGMGAAIRRRVHLQEVRVARALHIDQVGHRRDFGQTTEAFANALAASERLVDGVHACLAFQSGGVVAPRCPIVSRNRETQNAERGGNRFRFPPFPSSLHVRRGKPHPVFTSPRPWRHSLQAPS